MKLFPQGAEPQPQPITGPGDLPVASPRLFSARSEWLLVGLLIAAAAVIRVYGSLNDLWLDEIWSLNLVSRLSSPWQVFTRLHHDNNHYLNSLWIYWCGPHGNWPGYRLPSVLAGVGTVIMAGLIGRRRDARTAIFAMVLTSFSYVQILYSSEARGYSTVVFFSFVAFYALEKYMEKPGWRAAALFSASSIMGMASHLTFINFFAAALLWSGWRFVRSGAGPGRTIKLMLACHGAPAMFLAVLYIIDIHLIVVGGGTAANLSAVYPDSFGWALGAPLGGRMMGLTCAVAVVLFFAGLGIVWREETGVSVFFTSVIVVIPLSVAIVRHSDVLYVRYFLVGMAFFLILFSMVLAALWRRGQAGRRVCAVLLAGYLAANGWHVVSLFQYGRGRYSDAVQYLVSGTKGPVATVAGDQDFRIGSVLQFYARQTAGNKSFIYYPQQHWPAGGPEWFVSQKESFEPAVPPGPQMTDEAGNNYDLVKIFPTAPLSGLHWFIYHNRAKMTPGDRLNPPASP